MDRKTFNKFREIVYEKSGIALSEGKEALVTARVGKRMRALGISSHKEYLKLVLGDNKGEEIIHLLDAISTNVTHFFRESKHFDFLASVMSKWLAAGQQRFRFWSAASSTGEEPYSMAMSLMETVGSRSVDLKILATDISTRVLAKSMEGVYTADKVKTVPPAMLRKYFVRSRDQSDPASHTVSGKLKSLVVFRRLNLSSPPFPMRGPMDAIFCRNVMIYFDNIIRIKLLDELHRLLKPGGYLLVGHAESLTGMVSDFKVVQPAIYTK